MLTAEIKVNGRRISTVQIKNDGTGNEHIGNYDVWLVDECPAKKIPNARVEGWNRMGAAHDLVHLALEALGPKINVPLTPPARTTKKGKK